MKKRFCKTDPARLLLCWVVLITLLRCGVTAFQQAYIWVGGAPLDDELMFRAANAITAGQWLGPYDYLTLSKGMFFAVWLALLHALHIPYLLGGALLWCAASGLATAALCPLWQKERPAVRARLAGALYALLAFLPSGWASYTLRVYRDNIFPALCLLLFAGLGGAALRAVQTPCPRLWPWCLAAGLGFAAAWLTREDAGLFLLPFALAGTAITVAALLRRQGARHCAALALPWAVLAAGIVTVCALNSRYYGVFALSDFASGSFADAMGAMTRVATASGEPLLSVPADARQKLYEAVPELRPLGAWLEEDAQLQNDFRDPVLDDYRAGSFYWAIRRAAQFEGIYDTAQTAEAYWAKVAAAVNAACEDGTLPTRSGPRSGTSQPIRADYVAPTLAEAAKSLGWVLTFQDCPAYYAQLRSIGTEEDFAAWSAYLHCGFNGAAQAGLDLPYYHPLQKLVFGLLAVLRWGYAAVLCLGFALGLVQFCRSLPAAWRARAQGGMVPWLLLLGFLGMAALRCGMIAFVEVSSFGIGTSTMYLATVHPLLLLFGFGSLALARQAKEKP